MEQRGEAFTLAVTDGPRSADLGPLTLLTMLPLYVARIDPLRSRLRHLAVLCRRLDPREPPYDCPLDEGRNFARCSLGQRSLRASLFGPPSCLHRAQRWHADHGSQPYHGASPPTPTGNSRPSAMTPASAPWIADAMAEVAAARAMRCRCRPGACGGPRVRSRRRRGWSGSPGPAAAASCPPPRGKRIPDPSFGQLPRLRRPSRSSWDQRTEGLTPNPASPQRPDGVIRSGPCPMTPIRTGARRAAARTPATAVLGRSQAGGVKTRHILELAR